MIYALHPQCNISIHVLWGLKQQNTVFADGQVDHRPLEQPTDVGELMLSYGGGGHEAAGHLPGRQRGRRARARRAAREGQPAALMIRFP